MPDPVLALDLGGTKIRAALVHGAEAGGRAVAGADGRRGAEAGGRPGSGADGRGGAPRLEHVAEVPTPASEGDEAILEAAAALGEQVRRGAPVRAVGLSSAGVVDSARGRVTHATDSLTGWAGTDLVTPLTARLGAPVSALNDVHAHALGEARFGIGAGRGSLLLVAVGTGIGGGHVVEGRVQSGAHGAGGHVGHVPVAEAEGVLCSCGRTGHLEGLASGPGIVRLAARLGADASLADGRALAAAAAAGDEVAREAYRLAGFATGRVIGGLLNVLDPEVVALTGGVHRAGPVWHEALAHGIAHDAMDVVADTPVLPASAGEHAALLGAAARALDALPGP